MKRHPNHESDLISLLQECFEMPQSLGVIGGRPNHALYFVGCCDDQLVYLDPHTTQVREIPKKDFFRSAFPLRI